MTYFKNLRIWTTNTHTFHITPVWAVFFLLRRCLIVDVRVYSNIFYSRYLKNQSLGNTFRCWQILKLNIKISLCIHPFLNFIKISCILTDRCSIKINCKFKNIYVRRMGAKKSADQIYKS